MKIKNGFLLREVGSLAVVVAVGEAAEDFHKILTLNSTGAFLWKKLQEDADLSALSKALQEEFNVDEATALQDTEAFINTLNESDLVEN